MAGHKWLVRSGLSITVVALAAALGGCGAIGNRADPGAPTPPTSAAPLTSQQPPTTTPATTLTVPPIAARNLCQMMQPEVENWRIQGPHIGKLGLNAMVHEWALTNGGINQQVLADKSIVDEVTSERCPKTREGALDALELPTLASGLAF